MNTTPCKDLHTLVNFHSITFDLFLTIQVLRKASQKHAKVSFSKRRSMQINHR